MSNGSPAMWVIRMTAKSRSDQHFKSEGLPDGRTNGLWDGNERCYLKNSSKMSRFTALRGPLRKDFVTFLSRGAILHHDPYRYMRSRVP